MLQSVESGNAGKAGKGIATLRKNNATLQRIPRPLKTDRKRFLDGFAKPIDVRKLTFTYIKAALFKKKMALPGGFAGRRNNRTFGKKKANVRLRRA